MCLSTISSVGTATADGPSPMFTQSYAYTEGTYTNKPPSQEFPAAHLGPTDFHCERPLNSWTDPLDLNAGWLSGLVDINTEKPTVQVCKIFILKIKYKIYFYYLTAISTIL